MYDLGQISLACKIAREGNEVRVFEKEKYWKGRIKRLGVEFFFEKFEDQVKWVGKDGLIIFDYVGDGKLQDRLRADGYSVFGGCEQGEKMEIERQYGQKIFSVCGMKIKNTINFNIIEDAIKFVEKNPRKWVVKQNGNMDKGFNYVGQMDNARDVISILKSYRKIFKKTKIHIDLQERADGIEIAAGGFFNGKQWVGPICINIEHKNLFTGNLGPKTHEMGNLMWYEKNKKNKLFSETLKKVESYLKKIDFRGYFDINCIVEDEVIYPLEATTRLGQPTVQAQNAIHVSPWGEMMKAIADGKEFDLKYRKGFATVAFLGTPPYPYKSKLVCNSPKGLEVFVKEKISNEEFNNIHWEEVSFERGGRMVICGNTGYVAHVAGFGKTVEKARENMYRLIDKIVVPKVFYRTDIGVDFIEKGKNILKKNKWI